MSVKVGCDPEVFIQAGNYEYVSAHGILPGTKQEPYKVDKGAVQVDGFAFEFNIDPAKSADQFNKNIDTVLRQMDDMVKKVDKKFKLAFLPYVNFTKKYFESQPKESKILGCDPDFTINGAQQTPPNDLSNAPFRTASGHIHIGWTENMRPFHPDHFDECMRISRAFRFEDFYKPVTMLERKRFEYYGDNGAFRPKSYGIELRAPSNRWVAKEETRRKMYAKTIERFALIKK